MPVQGSVDRKERLELPTFDIEIRDPNTHRLLETLRFPVFPPGRFGGDLSDPGRFSEIVDPRTAICAILAPYAVAGCLARRGAW